MDAGLPAVSNVAVPTMGQLSPNIALGSVSHGRAVFCTAALGAHERVLSLLGHRVAAPTKYTIQLNDQEHLEPENDTLWPNSNHSCDPNCSIDFTSRELVTRRPVEVGEEITFNYLSSEWDLSTPFDCACGAPQCYRQIRGFRYLSEPQRRTLCPLLSPFLASRFTSCNVGGDRFGAGSMSSPTSTKPAPWWAGGTLAVGPEGMTVAGRSVGTLADEIGTPLYLYDGARFEEQLAAMHAALGRFKRHRIFFALKSNRFRPLLELFRSHGDVGIDACSPREVALAIEAGFRASEISVTASNFSAADLDYLALKAVHINFDQVGVLGSYGARVPAGTRIGLRIDPGVSSGYGVNSQTDYSGGKLGLAPEDFNAALAAAQAAGLVVDTLHLHLGWGLREGDESAFRRALRTMATLAKHVPTVEVINVGGGLGGILREDDRPLAPERWAAAIEEAFGANGPVIACEPGTFLTALGGLFVSRITSAWDKRGERWLGLDCGTAVNLYSWYYGLELEIIPVRTPLAPPTQLVNVAGHINEANDVFARARPLPALAVGDLVAFLPTGAYGSSMASDHCLRGGFSELLLWEGGEKPRPVATRGGATVQGGFPNGVATVQGGFPNGVATMKGGFPNGVAADLPPTP